MLDNIEDAQEEQSQVEAQGSPDQAPEQGSPVGDPVDDLKDQHSSGGNNAEPQAPSGPQTPAQAMSSGPARDSLSISELSSVNYEMLVDVPIKVTVELGRSEMTVQEILNLEKGSVIELNRVAGDPVDVFVNDYLIAKGEVVVVDDNFGVRITKIVASPSVMGKN